ncbi:MAG: PH domain-containing protein [Syntrophomonadaceae bacterium]|nr:PH domain-containing protein [Syntrophomonadaceae bacterium]MDD3889337.1 PH domain-containing protein [Syntrophomonadaceae bacterium]MDD4549757.1 PH domain-containing protein [Syntrophomonadaceae bacterium]
MYEPHRLHPAAILVFIGRNLRQMWQLLLPWFAIIISKWSSFKGWGTFLLALTIVIYILYTVLYWMRYHYSLQGQDFLLEYGLFIRKKISIPLERIHGVQISQGLVQRLFGLVKLEVETAGGGKKAEVSLVALEQIEAERLRTALHGENAQASVETETKAAYQLTTGRLLLAASTSNGIGVTLVAMITVVSQLDEWFPTLQLYEQAGQRLGHLFLSSYLSIILGIVLALILAWILSVVGWLARYGSFTLIREGDRILIKQGWVEKKQLNLPVNRLQAIMVVEGLLRRPLGLASIQLVSAGYGDSSGTTVVIAPLLRKTEISSFSQTVLPEFAFETELEQIDPRARFSYIMRLLFPSLLIAAPISIFVPYGYLSWLLPVAAIILGSKQYHDAAWAIEADKLILRSRSLGLVTSVIPRCRIQWLGVSQHLFQRRKGLHRLTLTTASTAGGASFALPHIESKTAAIIKAWFQQYK